MSTPEVAYVAGLFEGEGTVGHWGSVMCAVSMTDLEPLERLERTLGGKISGPYHHPSGHKSHWRWYLVGAEQVRDVFEQLRPWLSPRRVTQFQDALDSWDRRVRKVQVRPAGPDCGRASNAGYAAHIKKKEAPCERCRKAHREAARGYRAVPGCIWQE
jgi:hypothetical protein